MTKTDNEYASLRWFEEQQAKAYALEREAQEIRNNANIQMQRIELKREQQFRATVGLDCYAANDYCGLKVGRYRFYYGHEYTVPPDPEDDWDENIEWAFVAWIDGEEVLRLPTSELHPKSDEEPLFYLVAGIGHFLKQREGNQ